MLDDGRHGVAFDDLARGGTDLTARLFEPLEHGPEEFTRRSFVKFGAACSVALAAGGIASLAGCEFGDAVFKGQRSIVDDTGREVTIPTPQTLERVYFTSALAQIFCFTLAPDLLGGSGLRFSEEDLIYLPEGTEDLMYLGSLSGNGEIDREALLAEDIQLIFSISGIALTEQNKSEAEELQEQTGIPVVLIDGSFETISAAYRLLGDCLGQEDRGTEIATYLEEVYANVTAAIAQVPDEEKISIYYAEGPLGLQTEPEESQHALAFQIGGAKNVAVVDIDQGMGMSNVSLEQVLLWDPEVIVAWGAETRGGADEIIRTAPEWEPIRAVSSGRVYTMPNTPFAWLDRPPGVNRFLGIQWIANMLYPHLYEIDMVEVTKDFYERLYWSEITDDDAKKMLGNSYPPYSG